MSEARNMALERVLSRLLTISTSAAGLVMLLGLVMVLWKDRAAPPPTGAFVGVAEGLADVPGVLSRAARLDAAGVLQLGVLLLVLTPVARVVATLIMFAARRDRLYVVVTLIVLAVLVWGVLGGRTH